jgi:hypothetical protein
VKRRVVMFYMDYLIAEREQNTRKAAGIELVFCPT